MELSVSLPSSFLFDIVLAEIVVIDVSDLVKFVLEEDSESCSS